MRTDRRRPMSRGAAAFFALVCLSLLALVVIGMLRQGRIRRERMRAAEHRQQADWLVEAGLERAAARLGAEADYEGENWAIGPETLGGRSAVVVIAVEPGEGEARSVRVRAAYPADPSAPNRTTRTKVFQVRPAAGESGEPS